MSAYAVRVSRGKEISGCPCERCVAQGAGPKYVWQHDGWAAVCDDCLEAGSDFYEPASTRAAARLIARNHQCAEKATP